MNLKILQKLVIKKTNFLKVMDDNFKDMRKKSFENKYWGKNIYVKIPVIKQ